MFGRKNKTKIVLSKGDSAIVVRANKGIELHVDKPESEEDDLSYSSNMIAVLGMAVADQKAMDLLNGRFDELLMSKTVEERLSQKAIDEEELDEHSDDVHDFKKMY